jgi:hypothetical protein
MTTALPLVCRWDGETFKPVGRYAKEADAQFVVGQNYRLSEYQDRSDASHKHEFAWLRTAWLNMPESLMDLYPTPEHLRKRALIDAGYYRETIVDAGSNAAALRVCAAFKARDEFSYVVVRVGIVVIRDAMSQSRHAMGAKDFQESKDKVMAIVAGLIGVDPFALAQSKAA